MQVKNYILIITVCCFTSSCAFIQVGLSDDFNRYSTSGQLQPRMSDNEVRKLIGQPKKVATRRLQTDTRSVWTYKQHTMDSPGRYLFLGVLTFGFGFLLPASTEYHYLVFSDKVLVGWDLPDPYAPFNYRKKITLRDSTVTRSNRETYEDNKSLNPTA